MILKWTIKTLIVFGILYGIWYSFEFINPWIGIIAVILILAWVADYIIKKAKKTNKSKINKFKF